MTLTLWRAVDDYIQADPSSNKDAATVETALKTIHQALDSQAVQLLDLVVHLEKALSDPHTPQSRRQATMLLAGCLRGPSEPRLNFKHVETLARFFASKLSDWQCVEGALKGILALLVNYGPLLRSLKGGQSEEEEEESSTEPVVAHIARRVFKDVSPPSHTQQVRKAALDVVLHLLKEWREEVSPLRSQLGDGVSSVIEEERDPRNLLLSFTVSREVMLGDPAWVSEQTLETLFETLTSYFPVTFQPPKDDKIGITAQHLRSALGQALSASTRFAKLLVPFLLDNAKDGLTDGDDTIEQALELLTVCLQAYGPSLVQVHIREILPAVREQVCRTSSPCRDTFCSMARATLEVALRDVPAGLNPHWLELDVIPALKALAFDAVRGEVALASEGSRHLLLAAAAAHPLLLRRIWSLTLPRFLAPPATKGPSSGPGPDTESQPDPGALPLEAADFVGGLAELLEAAGRSGKPVLPAQRLQPALGGSLQRLRLLQPDASPGAVASASRLLELVGHLCSLVGSGETPAAASASSRAFSTLTVLLLPGLALPDSNSDADLQHWAARWRRSFESEPELKPCFEALVSAVRRVLLEQQSAARELAQALLASSPEKQPAPLHEALPRLLTETGLSLARSVVNNELAPDQTETAAQLARKLLKCASDMLLADPSPQSLASVSELLQASTVPVAALSWTVSCLAESLGLLEDLTRVSGLLGMRFPVAARTGALRSLVVALNTLLPQSEARSLRRRVLQSLSASARPARQAPGEYDLCVLLVPAVLPGAADEEWDLCSNALLGLCGRDFLRGPEGLEGLEGPEPGDSEEARESRERMAQEALRAAVEACPETRLQHLLTQGLALPLEGPGGSRSPEPLNPWALRCWASAAAALLHRGGCASQASGLLEALTGVLDAEVCQPDEGSPAAERGVQPWHVPLAFRDLLPPCFASGSQVLSSPLPPLALQQLSLTVLPQLVSKTRSAVGLRRHAALESAITLLCALPLDVVMSDCMDELRWCTLTSLRTLGQDPKAGDRAGPAPSTGIFAAQLLQLLLRSVSQGCPWIEDELHFIVSFLTGPGSSHEVPLIRLGSLQVLLKLVEGSRGHLAPFRRHIEQVTRRGIEDRVREVRLVAVACLNAWHCGASTDA